LKGETVWKALEEKASHVEQEPGSLFSVSPPRRVVTYISGPAANLLFSIVVLALIWLAGFTINTFDNRIVLLSSYETGPEARLYPADAAGLLTGDRIVAIDGRTIAYYRDLQETVMKSPERALIITVERDGRRIDLTAVPELNKSSGAGFLGVSAWIDPVVGTVEPDSAASIAGLAPGDRIIEANGRKITNSMDLYAILMERPARIELLIERQGSGRGILLIPTYDDNEQPQIGFDFAYLRVPSPKMNPFQAIAAGTRETFETLALSVKSLFLLGKGVNMRKAVSGPLRITYYVGEIASSGFNAGISEGLISLFRFLALISVALCFGNLLPIPALDGGMIAFNLAEWVARKQLNPKFFYRYQMIGFAVIVCILLLTTFNDIAFLFTKDRF
jgi:regulator of sigma E protease